MKEMHTIQKANVNYRQLGALNNSMIKLFDSDPVKFYEQFKLGKKGKEKKSVSILLGDLVDFYLLDCKGDENEFDNRYDEKFALYKGTKSTSQVFMLAETLFEITQESCNPDGEIMLSFSTRFSEACKKLQALGKYSGKKEDKILEDFNENGADYFQSLMENVGKTVVDLSLLEKAKIIAKAIQEDSFTKYILEDGENIEVFTKMPIEFTYMGVDCKAEPDILRVDHGNKKIYLMDLKTNYDNESWSYTYIKRQYYLQAAFYFRAVQEWAKSEGMSDYKIVPMEFVVGDTSSNDRRPIRYKTTNEDLLMALEGFQLRGINYKGLDTLINEIKWADGNDIWNCSKEVFDSEGIVELGIKYE